MTAEQAISTRAAAKYSPWLRHERARRERNGGKLAHRRPDRGRGPARRTGGRASAGRRTSRWGGLRSSADVRRDGLSGCPGAFRWWVAEAMRIWRSVGCWVWLGAFGLLCGAPFGGGDHECGHIRRGSRLGARREVAEAASPRDPRTLRNAVVVAAAACVISPSGLLPVALQRLRAEAQEDRLHDRRVVVEAGWRRIVARPTARRSARVSARRSARTSRARRPAPRGARDGSKKPPCVVVEDDQVVSRATAARSRAPG